MSVPAAILIGAGATLLLDLWTLFLRFVFRVPSLSYCLVGRWICHMTEGRFAHSSIGAARGKRFECAVGWIFHYFTGILFALLFLSVAPPGWLAQPTLLPAVLFGLATVLMPFLIMQPALGLGFAASKAQKLVMARMRSLVTHGVFGVGLYSSAAICASCRAT